MVRKLIKHELIAYFRMVWPVTVVALGLAALSWIMSFAQDSFIYVLLSYLMILALICGMIAIPVFSIAKRFQRTMFKGEGYMTFSIPATPVQLIVSKLIAAVILCIYTLLLFFLCSLLFSLATEAFVSNNSLGFWSQYFTNLFDKITSDPLLFIMDLVLLLVIFAFGSLFIFMGICVGQLFKSRKSMMSVLFFVVVIFVLIFIQPFLEGVYEWLNDLNAYLIDTIKILLFAALGTICFFVTKFIITHKLNLVV